MRPSRAVSTTTLARLRSSKSCWKTNASRPSSEERIAGPASAPSPRFQVASPTPTSAGDVSADGSAGTAPGSGATG